jgi:DNA-directed RNA polymerase specialized sigma24 family protein
MQRDLVERAMRDDRDAFAELQRRSIDKAYATARLILGDSDLAQDATQEAYIAAWRHFGGLRDPDRFEAWLRRLLVSACYREARKAKRRSRAEGRVRPIDSTASDPARLTADRDEPPGPSRPSHPSNGRSSSCTTHLGLPMQGAAVDTTTGAAMRRLWSAATLGRGT